MKIQNFCLVTLTAIALTGALIYTKSVLLPFVISMFIHASIFPLVEYFEVKLRVPRFFSVVLTVLLFGILSLLIIFLIVHSLETFVKEADLYRQKMVSFIDWLESLEGVLGFDWNAQTLRREIMNLPILSWVRKISGGLFGLLGNGALISIFTLFLLFGDSKGKKGSLVSQIQHKVSGYIRTKIFLSVTTGVLVFMILSFCGVDLATMLALMTILLNFIPSIGSIIATVLPLPLIIIEHGFGWQFYVVLSLSSLTQISIGNIIEPKMMGESMDLHPITVLMFLMFWGLVWGVPGMFMAVPITAVLKIVFEKIEPTKPISQLMAGRLNS